MRDILRHIRDVYNVPAYEGTRIAHGKAMRGGTIIRGFPGPFIQVHFDGDNPAQNYLLHPKQSITYMEIPRSIK
jgi:hypothetical protein